MLWSAFKETVRGLVSDSARDDNAYCFAISLFVLSELARMVDHDLQEYGSYRGQYRQQAIRLLDYEPTIDGAEIARRVRSYMTAHAKRRNVQEYVDNLITQARSDLQTIGLRFGLILREAVADIQHYIPYACDGHETIYTFDDVVVEGAGCRGTFPAGAKVRQVWLLRYDEEGNCTKFDPDVVAWRNRVKLVTDVNTPLEIAEGLDGVVRISVSPDGYEFMLWPALEKDVTELLVEWTGVRMAFDDDDQTPFDELIAQAAAKYVTARLPAAISAGNTVVQDMGEYRAFIQKLFIESGERARVGTRT